MDEKKPIVIGIFTNIIDGREVVISVFTPGYYLYLSDLNGGSIEAAKDFMLKDRWEPIETPTPLPTEPNFSYYSCYYYLETAETGAMYPEVLQKTLERRPYKPEKTKLLKTRRTGLFCLGLVLISFICVSCISVAFFLNFARNAAESNTAYAATIPVDEHTGLKAWADIYWLGGGLIEPNITVIDENERETYNWSLKLELDPEAELVQHFHEKESSVGIMTLESAENGVFVFKPSYQRNLLFPWIEHNFQFKGVAVEQGMNLKMYLVIHLSEGDHEIPIHIRNP